ncbi:hypothetical protein [Mesorhizobium sp.]|uniref:hypothetical protein n=1 Tax=Mesorhizobium sp. TaxID=1871066 RepID=UPI0025F34891|nr:hypothetical protein [Mesorhizobium sp.]
MNNADEARESGVSRGIDRERTARYVLDLIPESAGPRRATAQGSVIYSVRGPGSQAFPAKEHSVGIVLAPIRKLRASLGSDKLQQYDAPVGCLVINPAGVDSNLAWSATRENALVSISPEALSALAAHEFDIGDPRRVFGSKSFGLHHEEIQGKDTNWLCFRQKLRRFCACNRKRLRPGVQEKTGRLRRESRAARYGNAAPSGARGAETGISCKEIGVLQNTPIANAPRVEARKLINAPGRFEDCHRHGCRGEGDISCRLALTTVRPARSITIYFSGNRVDAAKVGVAQGPLRRPKQCGAMMTPQDGLRMW